MIYSALPEIFPFNFATAPVGVAISFPQELHVIEVDAWEYITWTSPHSPHPTLKNSQCFEKIYALTSPHAPKTQKLLVDSGVQIIETNGEGYVKDLNHVLNELSGSVLIVSGDLPYLDEIIIKEIITKENSEHDLDLLRNLHHLFQ